jgi:hypothetical protein
VKECAPSLNGERVDLWGLDAPESPRPGARGVTSYIMSQEAGFLVKSGVHDNVVRDNSYRQTGAGYDGPDQIGPALISALKNSGFIIPSGDVVHLEENFEKNIVPSLLPAFYD